MKTTPRKLTDNLLFALKNHPVVFLNGPRQAGKSTLVQSPPLFHGGSGCSPQ
jgi:predicted AAA+ superfamily ATPase